MAVGRSSASVFWNTPSPVHSTHVLALLPALRGEDVWVVFLLATSDFGVPAPVREEIEDAPQTLDMLGVTVPPEHLQSARDSAARLSAVLHELIYITVLQTKYQSSSERTSTLHATLNRIQSQSQTLGVDISGLMDKVVNDHTMACIIHS